MPKPRIMFYHDGRHPHIYRYEPPMQKEQYQACIDELVGTPVEAIMFCLGEGRTVLHDTKVGELSGAQRRQVGPPRLPTAPTKTPRDLSRRGMIRCASSATGHAKKGCDSTRPYSSRISARRWHRCDVQISAWTTRISKSVPVAT